MLVYAIGGPHPLREVCRDIVAAAGRGLIELHASVEMVQELVFHRMRMGERSSAVRQSRDAARLCVLHPFDSAVLERALQLISDHDGLGGRDAVHAATGLGAGITRIISPDRDFDGIDGLARIAPELALLL